MTIQIILLNYCSIVIHLAYIFIYLVLTYIALFLIVSIRKDLISMIIKHELYSSFINYSPSNLNYLQKKKCSFGLHPSIYIRVIYSFVDKFLYSNKKFKR